MSTQRQVSTKGGNMLTADDLKAGTVLKCKGFIFEIDDVQDGKVFYVKRKNLDINLHAGELRQMPIVDFLEQWNAAQ